MDNRLEKIKSDLESNDLNGAIDKLDRLMSGQPVNTAHVIERTIGNVENILRSLTVSLKDVIDFELPAIEKGLT
jgi:hypothetical protein